jgi:hypothetical protein
VNPLFPTLGLVGSYSRLEAEQGSSKVWLNALSSNVQHGLGKQSGTVGDTRSTDLLALDRTGISQVEGAQVGV